MDVEETYGAVGPERGGHGGGGNRPGQGRRDDSHSTATKSRPSSADREKSTLGKNDPLRKENRMWNLKHMKPVQEGRAELCNYCRLNPGVMVCSTHDLAKHHTFCFSCLEKTDSVSSRTDITTGNIKVLL